MQSCKVNSHISQRRHAKIVQFIHGVMQKERL
nr:MAG TPA: hypothetical protein [Bacteriophage sp.]